MVRKCVVSGRASAIPSLGEYPAARTDAGTSNCGSDALGLIKWKEEGGKVPSGGGEYRMVGLVVNAFKPGRSREKEGRRMGESSENAGGHCPPL